MGRIACLRFRRQLQRTLDGASARRLAAQGTPQTVQIPLTTFQVGSKPFGPVTLSSDISLNVVIDRTVAGGLNSLTSLDTLSMQIQTSPDGGVTWNNEVAAGPFVGGAVPAKGGGNRTSENFGVTGLGVGNQAQVVVTVVGAAIAIAGSVTVA